MSHELDKALDHLKTGWENATPGQKAGLLVVLHDNFGLSLTNMRELLDLTDGQMRYAWYKATH
jgi:hypothetical protein